jgi:hypothetical protein
VTIAGGAQASPGDLIISTRNDHTAQAGGPGRTLACGDLLRIEAITCAGLVARRALDADPHTGYRRWTGHHFLYAGWTATASSSRPPRHGTRPWPTPTTWPC